MIHYFNPGHETAVNNGSPYYMPPALQLKMRTDLAYLPAWYGGREDFVLVEEKLLENFVASTRLLRLPPAIHRDDFIQQRKTLANEQVECWGISPAAIHLFETINKTHRLNLSLPVWREQYKTFCSRIFARDCLQHIINHVPGIEADIVPQIHDTSASIESQLRERPGTYLAKAIYSSSGQGLLWLPEKALTQPAKQIIRGRLKRQGALSLERVLEKTLDFAMEFHSTPNGRVDFTGYSLFQTTDKGRYTGNLLMPQSAIEQRISSSIAPELLTQVRQSIQSYLLSHLNPFYHGIIGVDMMSYKKEGHICLHPCVEMNIRHNMGTLSIALHEKHLHSNATGMFSIEYNSQKGFLMEKDKKMKQQYPAVMDNERLLSGYLSLCPINHNSQYQAYMVVDTIA